MCAEGKREERVQQVEALQKGRAANRDRAAFKREIRETKSTARHNLAQVLDGGGDDAADAPPPLPDYLLNMPLLDYVRILPSVGDERALAIIRRAGVRDFVRPLGKLTDRQRNVLAHVLRQSQR
jgi:hypothetical protein